MISSDQIQLFMSLFHGRNDIYARHWERNGKHGYSPAYDFNWGEFMAFKAQGGRLSDFPNKRPKLLTFETIQSHLTGNETIGIYPLLTNNTSYFIAADFDKENYLEESLKFVALCKTYSIPAYIERSRSGTGAHVWIFFENPYSAQKSRSLVLELIRQALNLSRFEKEVSFDRLFPNQDFHSNHGFGNLISLPLNGKSILNENTAFIDPDTKETIPDQWEYIKQIEKVKIEQLDQLYEKLVKKNGIDKTLTISTDKQSSGVVRIFLRNQIQILKSELSPTLVNFLRDNLNFLNTEYLVKKRIGISTYQTEKYFKLINETGELVSLPRGFLSNLTSYCENSGISFEIQNQRDLKPQTQFCSKINLYDYQKSALAQIGNQESGVIIAPPGSGKTVIGLELVSQKSQPTLILVHRKQLLDQWLERIQAFLGISQNDIGQISGRKKKIGKQITVAMLQTLVKMRDINAIAAKFGLIIVDECHHIPAKTFRELIVQFDPYYLYGLTATPKRKYNDEKLIYYYIGNTITQIEPQKQSLFTPQTTTTLNIKNSQLSVPFDYKTDAYEVISKILIYDSQRNLLISDDILREIQLGRKILVLTERKEHVETLNYYLKSKSEVITLTGDDSVSKRKLKLDQINQGHFQVLLATGQLFGEGIDLPTLDCLFLVYPFSFEGKLIQYIGRIQRSTKEQVVYDYRDVNIPFFEKLFKKRLTYYRKRGWVGK